MEADALNEALKHDQAIKTGDAETPPTMVRDVEISPAVLVQHLDQKQMLLAKTVAAVLIDTARTLVHVGMTGHQKIIREKDGKQRVEEEAPKAETVQRYLEAAKTALELAHQADTLADKVQVRDALRLSQDQKKS